MRSAKIKIQKIQNIKKLGATFFRQKMEFLMIRKISKIVGENFEIFSGKNDISHDKKNLKNRGRKIEK